MPKLSFLKRKKQNELLQYNVAYYKTVVVKTVCYLHEDKQVDQYSRIESIEMNLSISDT